MAPDPSTEPLVAHLRALGRSVPAGDGDAMADAVTARLAASSRTPARPPRAAARPPARRRRAVVALVAVVVALVAAPPVRAAVAEWLGLPGVRVRVVPEPDAAPSTAPPPPTAAGTMLAEARRLVRFTPLLPAALGPPTGVEVSADRRVLSATWTVPDVGALRLDQFDGALDVVVLKTATGAQWVTAGDGPALWFERPHEVAVVTGDGTRRTEPPRLAGRTLIWQSGGVTLRLEGALPQERALAIARSTRPVP